MARPRRDSRTRILDATLDLVRAKGYRAMRVEDVCAAAGITKGSFFHHFESKDELAVAAAAHWAGRSGEVFAAAPYSELKDPLDRLLGYVDFRKALLGGPIAGFTCFAGTLVQEVHETHPEIRRACDECIRVHLAYVRSLIAAAMSRYRVAGAVSSESLALHTQAVIQGALLLAKAEQSAAVAADSLDHLRRYLELLFERVPRKKRRRPTR